MAKISFGGVAMVKTNPTFFDQCGMISNIGEDDWEYRKIGKLTVDISPDRELKSLRATIAWRNEVFAYLFPVSEEQIGIGTTPQWNEASTYYMKAWSIRSGVP